MLRLVNIGKQFTSQSGPEKISLAALAKVNLEIHPGEFFSLLGPSGCGKTTLLRIIAGLETATTGEAYWDNQPLLSLPPQKRPFNMVFQRYALFPHLSVFKNVAFGLEVKNLSQDEVTPRVERALNLVGLLALKDRLPETLSGGQAQRVALARALVNEPKIVLLDEPLSALDQQMREYMQSELRELQRRLGITFILVTHDQEEAMALSDRVAVMSQGHVEQVANPQEIYQNPQTHFVAKFVGSLGALSGQVLKAGDEVEVKLKNTAVVHGLSRKRQDGGSLHADQEVDVFVRPEKLLLGASSAPNQLMVKIQNIAFKGLHYELQLEASEGERLRAFVAPEQFQSNWRVGQLTSARFETKDCFVFERPKL